MIHSQLLIVALLAPSQSATPPTATQLCDEFEELSQRGVASATVELANCYLAASGRPQDDQKAISLLDSVTEDGTGMASNNLGAAILFRTKDKSRFPRAIKLLESAKDLGANSASMNLGVAYLNGLGVTPCQRAALDLIQTDAEGGNPLANLILFGIYSLGLHGENANPDRAQRYLENLLRYSKQFPADYRKAYASNIANDKFLSEFVFSEEALQQISNSVLSHIEAID